MIDIYLRAEPTDQDWDCLEDGPTFLVDGSLWRLANRHRLWRPSTDIYETEDAFVVRMEVGGMKEEDFSISLREKRLFICGTRTDPSERRAFHQMEIPFGQFAVEIELPAPVDTDRVEAFYREGFLKVTLPKLPSLSIHLYKEDDN